MKIITCPMNGERPASEFFCWGEIRSMPDPQAIKDDMWADYVFNRNGAPRLKREWWCHVPSNTWFVAIRNTQNNQILHTYLFDETAA